MAKKKEETVVESNTITVSLKKEYANLTSIVTERGILYFTDGKLSIYKNELDSIKEYVE